MRVLGNKMDGSSEVTELVILISAGKKKKASTTTYKLDPVGQFTAWTWNWNSSVGEYPAGLFISTEDTVTEQVKKTNVEFQMKFEWFDRLGQDSTPKGCSANKHTVRSGAMLCTQQAWKSCPLSREATASRHQPNTRLPDNNDLRHWHLVERGCPL